MSLRFDFDASILSSVVGGRSVIDVPRLNIHTLDAAESFLHSYGFNFSLESDQEKLAHYHRRALVLMTQKLGFSESEIPAIFKDLKQLGDIRLLLIYASTQDIAHLELQRWACAFLRCMHVFVHAENDLFSSFAQEIQSQILTPFQNCIRNDGNSHRTFLKGSNLIGELIDEDDAIELMGFETKPFKTSASTVIKLLAKPDALAMRIFDKVGVRFITRNLFDSFQVVRYLVQENIISFPHIMPDQSSNNLYPLDIFMQVCAELSKVEKHLTDEEIQQGFEAKLNEIGDKAQFLRKENYFSGKDYRFIKFISRKLIHIKPQHSARESFSFFYPFEVQIMDKASHERILSGPSEHQSYKERQRIAARKRLFPE